MTIPDRRAATGHPYRVLLIEESPADTDLMAHALRRAGLDPAWVRVETADALREALAAGPWDAVLSSDTLPGFGADISLGIVRAADPDLAFIVVAGTPGVDSVVELMRAGANDYVLKSALHRLAPAVERAVREAGNCRAKRAADLAAVHLAAVVMSSDDAILSKTLNGVITSWNLAAERLYGWTAAEAVGRSISCLVPRDKADELAGIMDRLRAGGEVKYFETVRLHRDGRRIDVSLTVSPVRAADGGMVGVSKTARDIRERKRADEALRDSEMRYRQLIESIPALVWVSDTAGRPVLHNRRWSEYTGQTPEELAAGHWHDALHPDDAVAAVAAWDRCKASGEPYAFEYRLRRADGEYRWFLSRKTPQRGPGGIEQWIGICTDIDDRKRAEVDLRQTTDLLRAVTAGTPDVVFVKDRAGRYLLLNPAAAGLVGRPVEELLGQDDTVLFTPADARRMMEQDRRLMASGQTETLEEEELTVGGVTRTLLSSKAPYRDAAGNVIGIIGIARDISDRKQAEDAVRVSEGRFRAFMANSPAASFIKDEAGRYLYANPAWEQQFDLRATDWQGKTDYDYWPRETADLFGASDLACLTRNTVVKSEETSRTADGEERTWLVLKFPLLDGGRQIGGMALEITERKRAEALLVEGRQRLTLATEAARMGVWDWDVGSNKLVWDERMYELYGIREQDFDGAYAVWQKGLHPDDRARAEAELATALHSGGGFHTQFRVVWPDGGVRDIEAHAVLLRAEAGRAAHMIGINWDVTDRKRAEDGLRLFRALMDQTTDGIEVIDPETGRFLDVNERACLAHGYTREEFLGLGVPDIDPLVASESWGELKRTGRLTGFQSIETLHRRKDGSTFPVEVNFNTIHLDRDYMVAVVRDITDRKRTESERDALLARLQLHIQRMPLAYILKDADFRIIEWNPTAERIFGYSREEMLETGPPHERYVPRSFLEKGAELLGRIRTGDMEAHSTNENLTKDGRTITCQWFNTPIMDDDGQFAGLLCLCQDVTARREAEATLRLQDRAIRAVTQGILITDPGRPDNPIVFASPGFERITGYGSEEVVGRNCRFLQGPDTDPAAVARVRAAVRTGEPCTVEVLNYRKDGTTFWNELSVSPVRDDAGRLTHFVGVQADVTERKRAEEAVRAGELLKAAIVESALDCIVTMDGEGRIVEFNPAAERTFGHPRAAVLGRDLADVLIPPAFRDRHTRGLAHYLATGEGPVLGRRLELTGARADGTEFPVEVSIAPLRIGGRRHFTAFLRDLTERKVADEALQSSQQRLRHVLASSPAVLFTLAVVDDEIRGINWISDNVREMLGYSPEDAFDPDWWPENIHPDDRDGVVTQTQADLFGRGHTTHEYRFRHRDETYRWTRGEIRLIRDATGGPAEAVGSWSDITARKHLEDQFRQAQKMEAFGQLAGGVAHDFNNLLTVINGYSDLLLKDLPPADPSRELVAEIHKAGERSAGLTRQLLAFSRQQVLAPRVLDLNEVVADTEKLLRRLIGEDVRLTAAPAPDLWPVLADPGQVEQILLNLCVNARDAMPTGGQLTIETRNVELDARYTANHPDARPGPHILLAVTDTGTGMTAEVRAKLFEPFFTTKEVGKGTGLGLATVYGIVQQSGGHVGVYSEVGVGTSFKVYFPRAEGAFPANGRARPAARAGGTETVLLVEDDAGVRALTRRLLLGFGYTVLEAADGADAARVAARHPGPIHLLVTDVVMPGPGGRAVSEDLAGRYPGLRVLYVSGYTDDAVVRHGVLHDQVHFLQKPFTAAALAASVRAALDAPA